MTSTVYALDVSPLQINSVDTITRVLTGSNYTTPPDIDITGGGGSGATAVATLVASGIASISVDAQGSGYTTTPTIDITGGGGNGALADAKLVATELADTNVTSRGTYLTAPTVTFSAPEEAGVTAQGTADFNVIAGVLAINITNFGSGYTNPPTISFSGGGGSGAAATSILAGTEIDTVTVTAAGADYTTPPDISFVGGGGNGAEATATLVATGVDTIIVTNGGINYTSVPAVGITGGGGSGATATANLLEIDPGTNILTSDISITKEMVDYGGAGILRLYFSFDFDSSPGSITVFNNGVSKGKLNADNDSQIVSNGYYRFDLDVEAGDNINLQLNNSETAAEIIGILNLRAHLVLVGA